MSVAEVQVQRGGTECPCIHQSPGGILSSDHALSSSQISGRFPVAIFIPRLEKFEEGR